MDDSTTRIEEYDEKGIVIATHEIEVNEPTIEQQKAEADKKLLDAFAEVERIKNLENGKAHPPLTGVLKLNL